MVRTRIQLGQRIRIGNPDPDPGRPKLAPQKGIKLRNVIFEESESQLQGITETLFMAVFDQKIAQLYIFTNFVLINLGLDPGLDWIRIQQQAG